MFENLGFVIAGRFHHDTLRLAKPVRLPDGLGGFRTGVPEDLGTIKGSLQSYSAEQAQKEYGIACKATRRLFCEPDDRVRTGILVDGWTVVTVPICCHSHMVALLEETGKGEVSG